MRPVTYTALVSGTAVILGPTGVGKSALAMRLAQSLGGEIVNADALQAYRGFDIGTAKPSGEERARVPHHLIDILDAGERYSAGDFARRAQRTIEDIRERGSWAVVVGGSGLYLRALLEGLHELPEVPSSIREQLRRDLQDKGLPELREELVRVDPATANRLDSGDTQRTLRALEIARATGQPLSEWLRRSAPTEPRLPAVRIGLTLPRSILYDRIAVRIRRMMEAGWLGEVEELLNQGVSPACHAFQAIGYRQLAEHLEGTVPLDRAVEEIARDTRRYAKRQLTWFRRMRNVHWIRKEDPEYRVQAASNLLIADSEGPS